MHHILKEVKVLALIRRLQNAISRQDVFIQILLVIQDGIVHLLIRSVHTNVGYLQDVNVLHLYLQAGQMLVVVVRIAILLQPVAHQSISQEQPLIMIMRVVQFIVKNILVKNLTIIPINLQQNHTAIL